MASQTIGIIINGATGRIGSTQHLANALIPIIAEGGLALGHDRLVPRLLLTGRDAERLAAVARAHNVADWSTDLNAALADPAYAIFFDAAATQGRVAVLEKALAAGKHVYCEKPVAPTAAQGLALLREARRRGVKHGVVEDKIHLPGLQKLAALTKGGELGRVVGFRLEFGWWVFDGSAQPCQRPSSPPRVSAASFCSPGRWTLSSTTPCFTPRPRAARSKASPCAAVGATGFSQ